MSGAARRPWSRAARPLLLALLPGVAAAFLIAVAFTGSLGTLSRSGTSWTGHAYQQLSHQIDLVLIGRLSPGLPPIDGITTADRIATIRASLENREAEFMELPAVEALGEARLARVAALFERGVERDDPSALRAAVTEANALNVQARSRLHNLRQEAYDRTLVLQRLLAVVGALVIAACVALLWRLLGLWREERRGRARDAARSRELGLMASHELRRPLQRITLAADLLQQVGPNAAERARLLALLQDGVEELARLSDFSRLETVYAEPDLSVAPHDLAALVRDLGRPRVRAVAPPALVWPVDAARLRQGVENLVENALKYAPGEVSVELHGGASGPEIHVVDRGPGLPPEERDRVFEPFYRAPDSGAPGQGLGLTIARRFARAHGGDLVLLPEPGGGTRAVLSLGTAARPPFAGVQRVD